jgi:hypothetical protein
MKFLVAFSALVICLVAPTSSRAQNTARIECARSGGYVYLYSAIETLDVRSTLQCGETVQLTSHYDNFYGVRTSKGETGFVPAVSIVVLKDQAGTGLAAATPAPARERIFYDERAQAINEPKAAPVVGFTLVKDTPIHLKLAKTVSSSTAHVGDTVDLLVVDDVVVEGIPVLTKDSKVSGLVAESEPKKHFGHNGKLAITVTSVTLVDGEHAPVRCYQEASTQSDTSSSALVPITSGKDVALLQDSEFTALVDGDFHPKRESFAGPNAGAAVAPRQR